MTNDIIDIIEECPNCHNPFSKLSREVVEMEAHLEETVVNYRYCSMGCFGEKLEKNEREEVLEFKLTMISKEEIETNYFVVKFTSNMSNNLKDIAKEISNG